MKQIAVVGSLNLDFVMSVPKRPEAGETLLAKDLTLVPGGKGANQACTLGRLGAKTVMLGAVGADSYGDLLVSSLQQAGVETGWLMRSSQPTGMAMIQVDPQGDNSILVVQGATPRWIGLILTVVFRCWNSATWCCFSWKSHWILYVTQPKKQKPWGKQ